MGKVMILRLTRLVASPKRAFIGVALVAVLSSLSFAQDGINDELRRCAAVDDVALRLACYDELGGQQESAPATVSEPPAATASERAPVPPDELGGGSLREKKDEQAEPPAVTARVTKCTKDASKSRYYFYLEGGQVWKQVNAKRLYFKECNFNVTISKDVFGYKMQKEGEKSKIRVSRVR